VPFQQVVSLALGDQDFQPEGWYHSEYGAQLCAHPPFSLGAGCSPRTSVFHPGAQTPFGYTLSSSNQNSTGEELGYVPKREVRVNGVGEVYKNKWGWRGRARETPSVQRSPCSPFRKIQSYFMLVAKPIWYAFSSSSDTSAALWEAVTSQAGRLGLWTVSLDQIPALPREERRRGSQSFLAKITSTYLQVFWQPDKERLLHANLEGRDSVSEPSALLWPWNSVIGAREQQKGRGDLLKIVSGSPNVHQLYFPGTYAWVLPLYHSTGDMVSPVPRRDCGPLATSVGPITCTRILPLWKNKGCWMLKNVPAWETNT
jgi:hypothetical protein